MNSGDARKAVHVTVLGTGIVGMTTALALGRLGISVSLFGGSTTSSSLSTTTAEPFFGPSVSLFPAHIQALREVGALDTSHQLFKKVNKIDSFVYRTSLGQSLFLKPSSLGVGRGGWWLTQKYKRPFSYDVENPALYQLNRKDVVDSLKEALQQRHCGVITEYYKSVELERGYEGPMDIAPTEVPQARLVLRDDKQTVRRIICERRDHKKPRPQPPSGSGATILVTDLVFVCSDGDGQSEGDLKVIVPQRVRQQEVTSGWASVAGSHRSFQAMSSGVDTSASGASSGAPIPPTAPTAAGLGTSTDQSYFWSYELASSVERFARRLLPPYLREGGARSVCVQAVTNQRPVPTGYVQVCGSLPLDTLHQFLLAQPKPASSMHKLQPSLSEETLYFSGNMLPEWFTESAFHGRNDVPSLVCTWSGPNRTTFTFKRLQDSDRVEWECRFPSSILDSTMVDPAWQEVKIGSNRDIFATVPLKDPLLDALTAQLLAWHAPIAAVVEATRMAASGAIRASAGGGGGDVRVAQRDEHVSVGVPASHKLHGGHRFIFLGGARFQPDASALCGFGATALGIEDAAIAAAIVDTWFANQGLHFHQGHITPTEVMSSVQLLLQARTGRDRRLVEASQKMRFLILDQTCFSSPFQKSISTVSILAVFQQCWMAFALKMYTVFIRRPLISMKAIPDTEESNLNTEDLMPNSSKASFRRGMKDVVLQYASLPVARWFYTTVVSSALCNPQAWQGGWLVSVRDGAKFVQQWLLQARMVAAKYPGQVGVDARTPIARDWFKDADDPIHRAAAAGNRPKF